MKKLISFCIAMIFLLSGCSNGDSEEKVSSIPAEELTIQTKSNIYEPDYFTDLYNKIGAKLGAADEDFLDFNDQQLFFSADGTVKQVHNNIYAKIPIVENPKSIESDYSYTNYQLVSDDILSNKLIFKPTGIFFAPDGGNFSDDHNYSRFKERMQFLSSLNMKELLGNYAVGAPSGFGLSNRINENFEDDFLDNGIFLDCTEPSNIKKIDRMSFSETLPYPEVFDDAKYWYGIFPYYQSDLTGKEMRNLYYDNADWENIIVLIVRK